METLSERTPLTQSNITGNNDGLSSSSSSRENLLKPNRSKWIALIIVLLLGIAILFAATNYNGSSKRNPTTKSSIKNNINLKTDLENEQVSQAQPHIIWFVADDLGTSDISMHGSEILTPNIDSLAKNGIELTNHYVMPLCSPSRASFLTGRHAFRMGVQATMSDLVKPQSIAHIPSSYTLAGEYFQLSGYKTYAYGKWHVGYAKESYTPIKRGFDKHIGFYQFAIDYNTKYTLDNQYGYDWYLNGKINWDYSDESLYTTFILTDEIENDLTTYTQSDSTDPLFMYIAFQNPHFLVGVPDDFESNCDMIEDEDRKDYCSHVQALDFAVGKVINSLKDNNLYDNTIIAFSTDNGVLSLSLCGTPGGHAAAGSAYPLRGGKYTLFEGGVNTPAIISGGSNFIPDTLKNTQSDTWFQAADWLPTLLHFTNDGSDVFYNKESKNNEIDYYEPDGIDMYDIIFNIEDSNTQSRYERDGYMILNIDYKDEYNGFVDSGIIYYNENDDIIYKMIYNHELYLMGSCDIYSAKPGSYPFESIINNDVTFLTNYDNVYLFELSNDKNEENDLLEGNGRNSENYSQYESLINKMLDVLMNEKLNGFMDQQDKTSQSDGDADNFNGAWEPWLDEDDDEFIPKESSSNDFMMMAPPVDGLDPLQDPLSLSDPLPQKKTKFLKK